MLFGYADVPVYNVDLIGNSAVQAGTVNNLDVDLDVSLNREAVPVKGNRLWKVSMWASDRDSPDGTKVGYTQQVIKYLWHEWKI